MIKFLTLLQLLVLCLCSEKFVRIELDAKWRQTPLPIEASEFIARQSNIKFWKYIESFQSAFNASAKELYNEALAKAGLMLSSTELDAMKFSLSIRVQSPKVQFYQQMADSFQQKCNIFFQTSDRNIACNLDDALRVKKNIPDNSLVHEFDHIYPGSEHNSHLIIVYGNFYTPDFKEAHQKIVSMLSSSNIKYILRHFYQIHQKELKVALSGYGVELAVKSTEYKAIDDQKVEDLKMKESVVDGAEDDEVEGFLFKKLREIHPDLQDQLLKFKQHLKDKNKELTPLHQWELQDLSFQAAQRVMSASSQDQLKLLKDISQNVPMIARSLVKTAVNENLRNEIKENQQEFERSQILPGDAALYINGIKQSVDDLDIFNINELLESEAIGLSVLNQLSLDLSKTSQLLALSLVPEHENLILDTRSDAVQWMNDLEKDSQYHYWPSHLQEMLRPTFPGMLRYVAKNIFHAVAFVDPLTHEGIKLLEEFNKLISQSMPARFGVIFVTKAGLSDKAEDDASAGLLRAFSFIKSDKNIKDAFKWLSTLYRNSGNEPPKPSAVISLLQSWYGKSEASDALDPKSDYDDLRKSSNKFFKKIGLKTLPAILLNGEALSKEEMQDLESSITEKILSQTADVQQAIYNGNHHNYPTIYDYLMSQPNVVVRLNSLIQNTKGSYLEMLSTKKESTNVDISLLSKEDASSFFAESAQYFIQDSGATTIWVIADATTSHGKNLIINALKYVQKQKNARLALFLHGKESDEITLNDALLIIFRLRKTLISGIAKFAVKFLEESDFKKTIENEDELEKIATGITGINKKRLFELFSSKDDLEKVKQDIKRNTVVINNVFGGYESLIIANGRIIGPLSQEDGFVVEDFQLLQNFENNRGGYKILEIIESMNLPSLPSEGHARYKSDLVMKISAALSKRKDQKRSTFTFKKDQHSAIKLKPRRNDVSFDIDVILDPLSKSAQKLVPIVMTLYDAFNVNLKIFLNCKGQHSELPVNRFYQYVLQPELLFNKDGEIINDQAATFLSLPHSALLTLIMDTPQSWLIEAVGSNQDLDNINLGEASTYVYGDFELENIIVEGHCSDSNTHQPPRGLQFILGTEKEPDQFDTIVMANFGYFQLKAFPGSFVLQLREGRSSQVYEMDSLTGGEELSPGQNYTVFIDSFSGKFLKVKVKRREGQAKTDLLSDDSGDSSNENDFGIWHSFTSYVKSEAKSSKNTDGKIHIFSVATGLLYERFLRIMMLSVLKHTKTPVKFWFLKNYLSSSFTTFLPHYAEKYGFEYELVQYQWPRWLNAQTEKQRIIWGYKILFLDVLFPLNLERIIFVDADQIVRADLKELMDMDLEGAPYAYTPFCNDRPEVEGFRFWNHGYWRNHLGGRPYHISALYVVDLKRFRKVAAGDRLRGQYQGLSQDPNSLANLDQDLPNNMIHQVEIKSLPQEWLWCETWCSDESKKYAKTIDMCNNPQTKEPKLQRAMRIAPEWTEYDDIIRALQEQVFKNASNLEKTSSNPTKDSKEEL
ncbi:UDP-glucose:glycoprotein glucosyltransferase 1 isoform X2 [Hydra vulgaris]|uniref:UDP-glucose:glycoprotein glucosyltransferase 1 isoform X2 n=1 Tax=Hydra vulgaris TaxID=6087 RepID=A0ABM4B5B1_HYDVU